MDTGSTRRWLLSGVHAFHATRPILWRSRFVLLSTGRMDTGPTRRCILSYFVTVIWLHGYTVTSSGWAPPIIGMSLPSPAMAHTQLMGFLVVTWAAWTPGFNLEMKKNTIYCLTATLFVVITWAAWTSVLCEDAFCVVLRLFMLQNMARQLLPLQIIRPVLKVYPQGIQSPHVQAHPLHLRAFLFMSYFFTGFIRSTSVSYTHLTLPTKA